MFPHAAQRNAEPRHGPFRYSTLPIPPDVERAMQDTIRFALSNFTLTFLVLGLIASCLSLLRAPKPLAAPVVIEALFSFFILFTIGFGFFANFVVHAFFGAMSARF